MYVYARRVCVCVYVSVAVVAASGPRPGCQASEALDLTDARAGGGGASTSYIIGKG